MRSRWLIFSGLALILLAGVGKFGYEYFYFDSATGSTVDNKWAINADPIAPVIELPVASPSKPSTTDVQLALFDLGIPVGKIDGKWGQRTRQAFCIWREMTGRSADRNYPIEIEQFAILNTKQLFIPEDFIVGLNVSKTCQSAVWVKDESKKNFKITIASTGAPGLETDSGIFKVGWTVDRWYESIAYPDGWMYRPQFFNRGQAIHGSEYDSWVWWYPASHGCVRMLGADIDALWAAGFGVGSQINVYGEWNPYTKDPSDY